MRIEPKTRGRRDRSATGLRVLVVEDRRDIADALKMLLELHHHQVQIASDGIAALKAGAPFAPDVALIDIGLPGIDGYEVARRLRAQDAEGDLRLIALSGRAEDQRLLQEPSFDHYIVKPAEPQRIIALRAVSRAE